MKLFRPEPTWNDYARWARISVIAMPILFAIAVAAIVFSGIRNPLTWVWLAITAVGLLQLPRNIRWYRLAKKRLDAGVADPPDRATLERTLNGRP